MTEDQRSGLLWSWNPLFDLPRVMNQRTQGGQEKKEKHSAKQRKWEKVKGSKTRGDNYDRCDESVRHDIKSRDRWQTGNSQKKTEGKHPHAEEHQKRSSFSDVSSLNFVIKTFNFKKRCDIAAFPGSHALSFMGSWQHDVLQTVLKLCICRLKEFNTPVSKILHANVARSDKPAFCEEQQATET